MKKLNLLNRCILFIYKCMNLVLRFFGINAFRYRSTEHLFETTMGLKVYSVTICFFTGVLSVGALSLFFQMLHSYEKDMALTNRFALRVYARLIICFLVRLHQTLHEEELIALLNELLETYQKIRILARHPNFFGFSHLVLCLVALQSMLRSLSTLFSLFHSANEPSAVFAFLHALMIISLIYTFIITVTVIILVFIGLIACYDELHHCTRRISNDVRALRLAQVLNSGQRLVLVEQLRAIMVQLITVRAQMFSLTQRMIKHFRFHLLMAIVYWLGHEIMIFAMDSTHNQSLALYEVSIGLLNLAFYCSVFSIFIWKSKLSKSFWHFHLLNFNKDFDRTVDELIYRELVEKIEVTAYGIHLDMRLFCRILLLTYLYFLLHFVYKQI